MHISVCFRIYPNCFYFILSLILEFDQGRHSEYFLNKFSVVGLFPRLCFHFKGVIESNFIRNFKHQNDLWIYSNEVWIYKLYVTMELYYLEKYFKALTVF